MRWARTRCRGAPEHWAGGERPARAMTESRCVSKRRSKSYRKSKRKATKTCAPINLRLQLRPRCRRSARRFCGSGAASFNPVEGARWPKVILPKSL